LLFIDPNQVATWARAVRHELDRRNEAAKRMSQVLEVNDVVQLDTVRDVMSVAPTTSSGAKNSYHPARPIT
jgi:hypothetical protein